MMRRYLLATTFFASVASLAHAQTCTAPAIAAAAGYTTETFGPNVTLGNNWEAFPYFGNERLLVQAAQNSNGSVTIDDSSNNYGAQLSSTGAFGGGGYFQATMSYPPGASGGTFWANDIQNMLGNNGGNWAEVDIAENDAITPGSYQIQYHNWYNTNGGQVYGEPSPATVPAGTDFSQPHTYGMLWVPATATTQGSMKFFFDGSQVGTTITWNQYVPGQSAQQNPFAVLDSRQLSLILGTGGSPTTVSNVQVWQNGTSQDTGTGLTATASGQPCPPVPASAPAASINTLATAASTSTPASPAPTNTPAPAPATQPAAAITTQDPTPGDGEYAKDCSGNIWTVSSNNKILENNVAVVGGGDTDQLLVQGCTVYGHSNGQNGSSVGWFTMGSTNPTSTDGWTASAAPAGVATTQSAAPAPAATTTTPTPAATPAAPAPAPIINACTTAVPGYATSVGTFGTLNGQFYDPAGNPWIAQGVNVPDFDMTQAQSTLLSLLPNTNFIRLNIYSYADPSTYQSFINWATSHGVVVEIDDHTSFPSDAFSGSQLTAETQFFSSMATAYKTNPYVWFETQNEPQGGDITGEETAVYNAVRSTGNGNPVGMQLYGGGNTGFLSTMNLSAYTSMSNVFIAPHFYDQTSDASTIASSLQGEISAAQQIQTAGGTPPVIIDEYGNSQNGTSIDPQGAAVVAAVDSSGYGSAAWSFMNPGGASDPADQVTNGGTSLTAMGQQIAAAETTPNPGCALSTTPAATTAQTTPALAPASTATTAPALAAASTPTTAPTLAANSLSVSQVATMAATQ